MQVSLANISSVDQRSEGSALRSTDLKRAAENFEAAMIKQFLLPLANQNKEENASGQDGNALSEFATDVLAEQISKSGGVGIAKFIMGHGKWDRPTALGQ